MDVLRNLFLLIILSGCQIGYLVKNGYNQAQLIRSRVSIDKILADPQTTKEDKIKINLANEARVFAETELGLKPTENYKTYVKLPGPYVTYIVQASPAYDVEHYLWNFPVLGKLPYKGFFEKPDADEEARDLESLGYDTMVRGVKAYSTLGWLKDPILSSMLTYKDWDLVNLIIHESTHTTLYIKSSADFNEQLASFIGNKGTELFYLKKEGPDSETLKKIKDSNDDEKLFSIFITEEIKKLKDWYKSNPNDPLTKKKKLDEIKETFNKKYLSKMKTNDYKYFSQLNLNNAVLNGYKTYSEDLSVFEKAFSHHNNDMRKFINFCKTLSHSKNPKEELTKIISI